MTLWFVDGRQESGGGGCYGARGQCCVATLRGIALHEAPNLVDGWRDEQQIRTNDLMLRNLMAVLEPVAPTVRHVALLQGTKAYGVLVRPLTVPAREGRSAMYKQSNFYWAQEYPQWIAPRVASTI